MQSKPQRASAVPLKTGQWKACEAVEKIWNCMKVAMTTCILVLGWQTEPTCSSYNGTLCYHAWGLSETNLWVRIACWGLSASSFHSHLKTMSGQSSSSFGYVMFSKVRHNRDGAKIMETALVSRLTLSVNSKMFLVSRAPGMRCRSSENQF